MTWRRFRWESESSIGLVHGEMDKHTRMHTGISLYQGTVSIKY